MADRVFDINPPGTGGVGFRIEELWAFLAIHEDGDEGLVGVATPMGMAPAVAADREAMHMLKPQMREIARATGMEIKLVRLHTREDVETIG